MLEITNTTKQKINKKQAIALANYVLRFYKKEGKEVSLVVIGDKKMHSLNYQFRGVDKTTDVLSFSGDKNNPDFLGEIFINIQEAGRTAKYIEMFSTKKSATYIFNFLLVHGLLHLLGYDDKTEKERQVMIILGDKFLNGFFQKKVL